MYSLHMTGQATFIMRIVMSRHQGLYDEQSSEVSWTDLELDVVFDKHGKPALHDQDEFDEVVERGGYTPDIIDKAKNTAEYLMSQSHSVEFPFTRSYRDEMLAIVDKLE